MNGNAFYVYEHWRSDKNQCFYVGKGQKARARDMRNRNRWHIAVQEKLEKIGEKIEVRIVIQDLSEIEAFREETRLINYWRSQRHELVNIGDGGVGGHTGAKHTEEWKQASRERMKAFWDDPKYRQKIVGSMTGRRMTGEQKANYVGPKSPEHCKAIRAAAKNRKRPVVRTEEHASNIRASLIAAWARRKSDPTYVAKKSERKKYVAKINEAKLEEKRLLKEKQEFDAAQARFIEFVYALINDTVRQCADCHMTKALTQFPVDKQKPHGRAYYCKSCWSERQRKIRAARLLKEQDVKYPVSD